MRTRSTRRNKPVVKPAVISVQEHSAPKKLTYKIVKPEPGFKVEVRKEENKKEKAE